MKLFKPIYEWAIKWAAHPKAEWLLFGLSFVEAFIFPIAPEVMLAPMALAKPHNWARYATISLCGSIVGAIVGYALGHFAFELVRPLLIDLGWMPKFDALVAQLHAETGWKIFWMLVLAGFLPIPLKVFTWAAGFVGVPLPAFFAGMIVGRGKRVYLLCGVIRFFGRRAEEAIHRWIEWIGWGVLALIALIIVYFKFLS
ncbi:MAG TPA: YqaA family protein [Rudaea sp.]|jgi:membrane protein YqaA with SNARE-associated domain|nr:YqaA family protein [Rudaea sp.]